MTLATAEPSANGTGERGEPRRRRDDDARWRRRTKPRSTQQQRRRPRRARAPPPGSHRRGSRSCRPSTGRGRCIRRGRRRRSPRRSWPTRRRRPRRRACRRRSTAAPAAARPAAAARRGVMPIADAGLADRPDRCPAARRSSSGRSAAGHRGSTTTIAVRGPTPPISGSGSRKPNIARLGMVCTRLASADQRRAQAAAGARRRCPSGTPMATAARTCRGGDEQTCWPISVGELGPMRAARTRRSADMRLSPAPADVAAARRRAAGARQRIARIRRSSRAARRRSARPRRARRRDRRAPAPRACRA